MSTKKKPIKDEVIRRGTGKRMYGGAYPKRYLVEVELTPDGKGATITRRAENMTGWELYGLLRVMMLEIEDQLRLGPPRLEVD